MAFRWLTNAWQIYIINIYQDILGIIIRESCTISCNDTPGKLLFATDNMNQRSGTILTNTQLFPSQNITTRNIYALGICTRRGLPDPPTPYLGLSPKKNNFWDLPLNLKQSFQLRKIDALWSMHPAHFARWVLKSNNIAIAHSIYPIYFWPEERH